MKAADCAPMPGRETRRKGGAEDQEGGSVKEMAAQMEKEIDGRQVLNLKYLGQNFHMQKEMALFEKKKKGDKREKGG